MLARATIVAQINTSLQMEYQRLKKESESIDVAQRSCARGMKVRFSLQPVCACMLRVVQVVCWVLLGVSVFVCLSGVLPGGHCCFRLFL